jgi:hypothetical protein
MTCKPEEVPKTTFQVRQQEEAELGCILPEGRILYIASAVHAGELTVKHVGKACTLPPFSACVGPEMSSCRTLAGLTPCCPRWATSSHPSRLSICPGRSAQVLIVRRGHPCRPRSQRTGSSEPGRSHRCYCTSHSQITDSARCGRLGTGGVCSCVGILCISSQHPPGVSFAFSLVSGFLRP